MLSGDSDSITRMILADGLRGGVQVDLSLRWAGGAMGVENGSSADTILTLHCNDNVCANVRTMLTSSLIFEFLTCWLHSSQRHHVHQGVVPDQS